MKGLFVFSDMMEDVEGLATRALLIRSGLDITTTTLNPTNEVKTSFNQRILTDTIYDNIDPRDYDFLILPGGPYVAKTVDQDTNIKALSRLFYDQNKLICAICAGPRFLGQAGLLSGKKFTAYPGNEIDMPNGHYHPNEKVIKDGNIITSRGAGTVYDFAYEIIKTIQGKDKADQLLEKIAY